MIARLIVLAAFLLPAAAAEAQSFNCRYARYADEITICQDARLSRLDERMSRLFYRLRDRVGGARLDSDQDSWLRARRACGRDASCIEGVYRLRIGELRG